MIGRLTMNSNQQTLKVCKQGKEESNSMPGGQTKRLQPLNNSSLSEDLSFSRQIPWMEEPGRLQSMESLSQTQLSDFTFTFHFHALEKEIATHSSVLAWRTPGTGEPGGLPSRGSHRVGHD